MQAAALLSGIFLLVSTMAFLTWGGTAVLLVGIISAVVCVSGMGGFQNRIMMPGETIVETKTEEEPRKSFFAKDAYFWSAPVAFVVLVSGIFLFGSPPPF